MNELLTFPSYLAVSEVLDALMYYKDPSVKTDKDRKMYENEQISTLKSLLSEPEKLELSTIGVST